MSEINHAQNLAEKLLSTELKHLTDDGVWPSNCIVIKRLLDDTNEMRKVWEELWKKTGSQQEFKRVLDLIVDVAAGWGPIQQKEHRSALKRFSDLNAEINSAAQKLSDLLKKQRELAETQSIAGRVDRNLMDFIACWAGGKHLFVEENDRACRFKNFVWPELARIRKDYWSSSYWPSIIDLISTIGSDNLNNDQESTDELHLAALASREGSKLDFLRALLTALDEDREQGCIPDKFSFTSNSLAKIVNCAFGLVDDTYSEVAMKKAVQRIRKEQN